MDFYAAILLDKSSFSAITKCLNFRCEDYCDTEFTTKDNWLTAEMYEFCSACGYEQLHLLRRGKNKPNEYIHFDIIREK